MATTPADQFTRSVEDPADAAAVVTPSDSVNLDYFTRAVFVGGAGNLAVVMKNGMTVVFTGVVAGSVLPIRCARINSTNTTATNIVALW